MEGRMREGWEVKWKGAFTLKLLHAFIGPEVGLSKQGG